MDDDLTQLRCEVGRVVEGVGRMLQRKSALTHEDLTLLRDTLNFSGHTIQTIRDIAHTREGEVA